MTNYLQSDVRNFHLAMGHPAPSFPVLEITDKIADLRIKRADWLIEEANELKEAAEERDLVKALDAFGDSIYFGVGGYVMLGHDLDVFWNNIQHSNMAKLGPDGKPVPHPTMPGKIGKPEGWIPPEAHHAQNLQTVSEEARIEGLAIQLAWSRLQDPDLEVSMPESVKIGNLLKAVRRAGEIYALGESHVTALYQEMLDFLTYIGHEDERESFVNTLPKVPTAAASVDPDPDGPVDWSGVEQTSTSRFDDPDRFEKGYLV